MSAVIPPEQQRILDRFPPVLKALVLAELAAGNTIVEAGAGHPAPPAGDMIKLGSDLRTIAPADLKIYARNGSKHHTEITDADRFFFILTAPHDPPPLPDMDAIRLALRDERLPAPKTTRLPGTIELDHRGEMLIYREPERITDIIWTWSQGNHFYRSSLTHWWYPLERRSVPLTEAEKEELLQTFLDFGHAHIGSTIHVVDSFNRLHPTNHTPMSWTIALLVAVLTGVFTAIVTAPVADKVTRMHKVSDREGGRGMAVLFFFVPAGLIGGFLLGLLGTYLVHATEWAQFWKAAGVSVLLGQIALFGIAGLSLLGLPNPPKLDGLPLALEVEVFVPLARVPSGRMDPQKLTMSLYAGSKDNQYADVDTAHIRVENGHIMVPGSVRLNSRAVFRMFSFTAQDTLAVTLDPLALFPSPTAKDLQWTEPTPMRLSEVTGPGYTYTDVLLRFRVVKVAPEVG